jgi:phospholipid/cholesterol/gamma-HCH transport system ATP-binding protein
VSEAPAERTNYLLPDVARWPKDPDKPVIRLRGVVKRFDDHVVLDGLDLDLHTGLTTVICGQSGSGKSVLLKLMNGLLLPDEGTVELFGQDTRSLGVRQLIELRKRVSMMFQSYALMDSFTVHENIAFPIYENTSMRWKEISPLVRELLELLDLADAGNKMPSELSGGMKKRVSLARAVVSNPEVVLFDEPTTGLDPVMIEFVDDMIVKTRERYGITSVVISHDMTSTLRLADRIAMLDGGKIVAYGSVDEVLKSDADIVKVFFEGADRVRGLGGSTGGAKPGAGAAVAVAEAPAPAVPEGEIPAVEVIDLHKSFGEHKVLTGVSIAMPKHSITVLIGGSGSGKSVIMKHIIGLFRPDSGVVKIFGTDLATLDTDAMLALRTRFGMLFQGAALLDSLSVRENVSFPLWERGMKHSDVRREADAIMEQLRIADIAKRYPSSISNGQRKRVGLARAIVTKPEIMIYDEPTTGQDPIMTRYVDDMIVEAQRLFDITSLVVSHDMASAFRIGDRVAMLHRGEIRAYGTPEEVRANPDPWVRRFIYAGTPEGERASHELGLV